MGPLTTSQMKTSSVKDNIFADSKLQKNSALTYFISLHCTVDYTYFNTSYFRLCRYIMYLKIYIKISIVFCEARCHDAFCLRLS